MTKRLLIALFLCTAEVANAEELPAVYVSSEQDDANMEKCQIRNASVTAAVESELRYNRVPIASRTDWFADQAIRAYVSVTAVHMVNGVCATAYELSLNTLQKVELSLNGEERYVTIEFCEDGGVMTGTPLDLQSRLNAAFRESTSVCISKFQNAE